MQAISQMAEGVGFEPTFAKKAKAVFKTATISRSVTPPDPDSTSKQRLQAMLTTLRSVFCQDLDRLRRDKTLLLEQWRPVW